MKKLFTLFFILFFSVANSYGKKKITGYYVTNSNDTIHCTFLVPFDFLTDEPSFERVQSSIYYLDSQSVKQELFPKDVKAYLLIINGKEITFLSRRRHMDMQSLFSTNDHIFLKLRIDGYLKMFDYYVSRQTGGMYNHTTGMLTPGVSSVSGTYCLQKEYGELNFIRWISFKKELSKYLSDYPELAEKILKKEYTSMDIESIVKEYNEFKTAQLIRSKKRL